MIAKAKAKFVRGTPTKVRQVIDLIRGKNIPASQAILTHVNKGSTKWIRKVLDSAVANAKQKGLMEDQLYISKITADQGPMMKRWRAAAFGRATPLLKRTTHLTIELDLITK
ncbi:MAG TPA: 50S ribosomal protein L22 [Candidatus Omnitrophota bacterium]|nr:50S ribosomal protein L22 [Candidatus Omnitrophota bacterium]